MSQSKSNRRFRRGILAVKKRQLGSVTNRSLRTQGLNQKSPSTLDGISKIYYQEINDIDRFLKFTESISK